MDGLAGNGFVAHPYLNLSCGATIQGMEILYQCFGGSGSPRRKQPSTTVEDLCHRFSLTQLRESTDDFDGSRFIGEGPYGVAYRGCISIDGQLKDIAVKRLRQPESYGISLYKNEIIFMCQLRHPNLLSLVGFCDDRNEMIVVYDYAPNRSLYHQIHGIDSNSPIKPWKKRLEISIGVARGLHYLHSGTKRTVIHRHITSAAILLGENWVPKLGYFGLSLKGPKFSARDAKPIKLESIEGPWVYTAPECLRATNVTHKSDVYSFGVVLLELVCGKTLSQISEHEWRQVENTADFFQFTMSVVEKVRDLAGTRRAEGIIDESLVGEIGGGCWKLYMDITESCLNEDPNERPDMGDIEVQLEHLLQLQEDSDSNNIMIP
ncbi:receptor-like protein kinase ANXUR1 [Neltuma alba]|uniref:receptor-like protein kinase ANXUR1 n=1 Tax=Neltuma alba TaxID=207710 RepID=UPI0010A57849|nr:receptor-like protein kinase ANXUR1 [Prosopis alba]